MNRLTPLVVRAFSLVAAAGITTLIISVHAADMATLGARDIVVSRVPPIVHMDRTNAQPAARVTLADTSAR